MKSPFKFLDAFELKDRDVFFGRNEEIETLYNMVFQTPLLLLFGLSGTGKTSLIRCGLASRYIGPNWYPFYIRRGDNINLSLAQALSNALPEEETPLEYLKDNVSLLFRHYLRPIYLIFDQFEELFILGERQEQELFAQSLRELIEAKLPCKIILVMREEFIGQLYYLEKEIPSIYDFRLRVEPMGMKKVQEVITGSLQHFQVQLADPAQNLQLMYNNISVGKSGVQLPHLQVYLDMFWREDFARTYPAAEQAHLLAGMAADPPVYPPLEFIPEEIDNFGNIESVLARFLAEQESNLQAELRQQFGDNIPEQAVRQVLDLFVSEQGTKKPRLYQRDEQGLHLSDTAELLLVQLSPPALSYALNQLYESRLLRERDDALELAHDSLAALIFRERSDEQRKISDLLIRLQNAQREFELSEGQELPSRKLLLDTEELLAVLPLSPELRDFYEQSQAEWQRRSDLEQAEAERRARNEEIAKGAEEEARLRRVAEKARRRAILGAILAAALAVVAISLGIVAFRQKNEALEQRDQATNLRQEAEDLAKLLENQKNKAVTLSKIAVDQTEKTQAALAQLSQETAAKEQLQFSNKADIVQSFLNAGYCQLAEKALADLEPLVKKYPGRADFQSTARELREQFNNCKSSNPSK